jgi:hypothetical protein
MFSFNHASWLQISKATPKGIAKTEQKGDDSFINLTVTLDLSLQHSLWVFWNCSLLQIAVEIVVEV